MGYWLSMRSRWMYISKVIFHVWTKAKLASINAQYAKGRMRPISSHLDWTSLVNKVFIIRLLGNFSLRTWQVVGPSCRLW